MNNRENWTPDEWAMQKALDRVREDDPDFWTEVPEIPASILEENRQREAKLRRKTRRRIIAACFAAVCILSVTTAIFLNSDTAHAIKFAMEKRYYQAKGWIQATDSDSVDDENVMIFDITTESSLKKYAEVWDFLMVPTYMLDGYNFSHLHVERYITGKIVTTYTYDKNGLKLNIVIRNDGIKDNTQLWIVSDDVRNGEVNYRTWTDEVIAVNGLEMIIDNNIISIHSRESISELIEIGNGLQ